MTYVLNSEGMVKAVNDEHFLEKEKPIIPANPPRKWTTKIFLRDWHEIHQ